jgi:hypothetical protein
MATASEYEEIAVTSDSIEELLLHHDFGDRCAMSKHSFHKMPRLAKLYLRYLDFTWIVAVFDFCNLESLRSVQFDTCALRNLILPQSIEKLIFTIRDFTPDSRHPYLSTTYPALYNLRSFSCLHSNLFPDFVYSAASKKMIGNLKIFVMSTLHELLPTPLDFFRQPWFKSVKVLKLRAGGFRSMLNDMHVVQDLARFYPALRVLMLNVFLTKKVATAMCKSPHWNIEEIRARCGQGTRFDKGAATTEIHGTRVLVDVYRRRSFRRPTLLSAQCRQVLSSHYASS